MGVTAKNDRGRVITEQDTGGEGCERGEAVRLPASGAAAGLALAHTWPLQDILSLRGFRARINHVLPPPTCISHTIAILSRDYCVTPRLPFVYAIHHTILVMAINLGEEP